MAKKQAPVAKKLPRKPGNPAYVKGMKRPPNSGRKPGTPNKFTGTMKQAVMAAFQELGAEKFLIKLGKSRSESARKALLPLFGKMLPLEVSGPDGDPVKVTVVTEAKDV